MTKTLAALFAAGFVVATMQAADAKQDCGRGFHRNLHGYCVRNHRHWAAAPMPAYAPPPPPMHTQVITAPARTGIIPGSGNSAHAVCSYGYHPGPTGQCQAN